MTQPRGDRFQPTPARARPVSVATGDGSVADAESAELMATIEAAASGDEAAWSRLVSAYSSRVFAMVRSRVRDPELAEEITQSVFATVARQFGSDDGYREQGRFEPWLFRIALNRIRDEARRRKRRANLQTRLTQEPRFAGEDAAATDRAHEDGVSPGQLADLRGALESLSAKDREVIELRHHAQMSFKQIAESLGEPVGTLLARHHRALRKLRTMLEPGSTQSGHESGPGRGTEALT